MFKESRNFTYQKKKDDTNHAPINHEICEVFMEINHFVRAVFNCVESDFTFASTGSEIALFLVTNATKHFALATRISQLVASERLTLINYFMPRSLHKQ